MSTIIRTLNNRDHQSVCDLSAKIWDGNDYLANVAKAWINDGGFYGLELDGKIIGTAKMTQMPNRVIWLEGLRIHPDFQKKGYGKMLSEYIMKLAVKTINKGKADAIEFSTYYKNEESIGLAKAAGFKLMEKFYILSHKPVEPKSFNLRFKIHPEIFPNFDGFIPFGWKFIRPNMKSLRWLNKEANMVRFGEYRFFAGGEQPAVTLVSKAGKWIKDALPQMQYVLGAGIPIEVILPEKRKDEVQTLLSLGFKWWEKDTEDIILVYRHIPK